MSEARSQIDRTRHGCWQVVGFWRRVSLCSVEECRRLLCFVIYRGVRSIPATGVFKIFLQSHVPLSSIATYPLYFNRRGHKLHISNSGFGQHRMMAFTKLRWLVRLPESLISVDDMNTDTIKVSCRSHLSDAGSVQYMTRDVF